MNQSKLLSFFFCVLYSVSAFSYPDVFDEAPFVDLPLSIGRTTYDSAFVDRNHNAEHIAYMELLENEFIADNRPGIFSVSDEVWIGWNASFGTESTSWNISRLKCGNKIFCFLLDRIGAAWLVTFKGEVMADFQLVRAMSASYSEDQQISRYVLDSVFGDGVLWQQLPVTEFERTGIFCSHLEDLVTHVYKSYKRRITPEGQIESKELGEGEECKAPW